MQNLESFVNTENAEKNYFLVAAILFFICKMIVLNGLPEKFVSSFTWCNIIFA